MTFSRYYSTILSSRRRGVPTVREARRDYALAHSPHLRSHLPHAVQH